MDGAPIFDDAAPATRALLQDTLVGLGQRHKTLSPKWLYDHRGSVLFEEITRLPEYYLTRTETGILRDHASHLAGLVPAGGALVELGAGASVKTRLLLDAGDHFGTYVPIDISHDFLLETADTLRGLYPSMDVAPITADFASPVLFPEHLKTTPKVGFFPGSTIGNLEPNVARDLLVAARNWPNVERFVLGADLVKDIGTLVAAYDDAQGVTAQFIGNILVRLNTELGADFDNSKFSYRAEWNASRARIDMKLVSDAVQTVAVAGNRFQFDADEAIHISASRKYTQASLDALISSAGWKIEHMLTDAESKFAVAVLSV